MNPGYPTSISHVHISAMLPMPCCCWAANLTQEQARRSWDPTSVSFHIIPCLTEGAEKHLGRKAKPGLCCTTASQTVGPFPTHFLGIFQKCGDPPSFSRKHHSKLSCNCCLASGCVLALGRSQARLGIYLDFGIFLIF